MVILVSRGLAPVREELQNGAVIIAKQSRTTPAVTIHASFGAGILYDPQASPGVAHLVSRMLDRGTTSRSAAEIADELDSRGVSLNTTLNRHVASLVCNCLTEDFDAILALLADIGMHATFPEDELAVRRPETITMIRQDEDSPATMAIEGLLGLLYPGHPYGTRPRGTVESVEHIPRSALQAFHAARFRPATLSLVIVGDVAPAQAIEAASRAFGEWKAPPPAPVVLPPVAQASGRRRLVMPMMNKVQADIAYGFVAILRSDPAYYAYHVMNNILGQYSLGGRLGDSIRERQGMAYYCFSALDANRIPGPLTIRAGVNPANVGRAVASIDVEVDRMAADGPTDKELRESKQYLVGSMPRTLETNTGIATFLQTAEFFGLGLDYDLRLPGLIHGVTREAVHEAARNVLASSRASVAIAGPYGDA
ncbi:MAG: M16 family metallopeptidase [Vicinamibacterales bacterium]